jgi:putative endonuclease
MLTNDNNTVIYIGVTSDLEKRLWQHKSRAIPGFTKRYNCSKLVWYEVAVEIEAAIAREKQLKSWSRKKKEALINELNAGWSDLSLRWNAVPH